MESLVKVPWSIVFFVSQLFRANQIGFGEVFDNLTFNYMTTLRRKIQSVADYFFKLLFLAACSLKQILTIIVRIKLL